ncbi:MAG: arginyltransferase [Proteobacteria bacterium]|nr:arginyltransferase [Pseudomonadota bacterium]
MELQLFESNNGDCPYLDNHQWFSHMFRAESFDNKLYESLLNYGFRRSGYYFYRNNCPKCNECISIRILAKPFKMSRSQKRVWKKNQDIVISQQPVAFDEESYRLYRKYSLWKHGTDTTVEGYRDFLVNSAVDTVMMKYYDRRRLVGIGWLDILPRSVSSVYFAFDPDFGKRSLGVFSALKEIELARILKKPILHMGFWVRDCASMVYKSQYKPYQLLIDGRWMEAPP